MSNRLSACRWAVLTAASTLIAASTWGISSAQAENPLGRLAIFKKIDADPNQSYTLTDQQGPWMIMAHSFSGEDADQRAHELMIELRSKHKLTAYVHRMSFDFDAGNMSSGVDRYGAPRKMKYRKSRSEEVAVLIGDFATMDDPLAQKALEKIKHLQPACLAAEPEKAETATWVMRTAKGLKERTQTIARSSSLKNTGPMSMAFITSNPRIPEGYFKPKGIDKFIVDMNKKVKHSLLNCPGRYTVRVATFTTPKVPYLSHDKQKEAAANKLLDKVSLDDAAERANRLTEALRARGVEAYEFHDRTTSIVTVGHFDSLGQAGPGGAFAVNPQIQAVISTYGAGDAMTNDFGGAISRPTAPGQPKVEKALGLPYDPQPAPIEVPRHSISADYNERL